MKAVSLRSLALATVASLAMASSGSAITILQYGQVNPNDFKTATASGGVTTITTGSPGLPTSIPVTITNIGGIPLPGAASILAFETWTGVVSTSDATMGGTPSSISQAFRGTVAYTSAPGGGGINFLTAVFTGASLSGLTGGGSASLVASDPPVTNVVYESTDPRVQAALATLGPDRLDNFAISFSGITQPPGLSITGTGTSATIASFTAQNSGTFSSNPATVIPEPSGLVLAGMAMLGGLGCFGWRRRQSSQA